MKDNRIRTLGFLTLVPESRELLHGSLTGVRSVAIVSPLLPTREGPAEMPDECGGEDKVELVMA